MKSNRAHAELIVKCEKKGKEREKKNRKKKESHKHKTPRVYKIQQERHPGLNIITWVNEKRTTAIF